MRRPLLAILLLAPLALCPSTPAATAAGTAGAAGKVVLEIVNAAGKRAAGYVQRFSGGSATRDLAEEIEGGIAKKHLGESLRFEPFTVKVGVGFPALWLETMLKGGRFGGRFWFLDANQAVTGRIDFSDAYLLDLTLPALDAAGKDPGGFEVVFQPGSVERAADTAGGKAPIPEDPTPKKWLPSNFAFELGGVEATKVSKVEAFTLHWTGEALAVSNLKVTLAGEAPNWRKWYQSFVVEGQAADANEKTLRIDYLLPNRAGTILSLQGRGVGILALRPSALEPGVRPMTLEAELYVEQLVPGRPKAGGPQVPPPPPTAAAVEPPAEEAPAEAATEAQAIEGAPSDPAPLPPPPTPTPTPTPAPAEKPLVRFLKPFLDKVKAPR